MCPAMPPLDLAVVAAPTGAPTISVAAVTLLLVLASLPENTAKAIDGPNRISAVPKAAVDPPRRTVRRQFTPPPGGSVAGSRRPFERERQGHALPLCRAVVLKRDVELEHPR